MRNLKIEKKKLIILGEFHKRRPKKFLEIEFHEIDYYYSHLLRHTDSNPYELGYENTLPYPFLESTTNEFSVPIILYNLVI